MTFLTSNCENIKVFERLARGIAAIEKEVKAAGREFAYNDHLGYIHRSFVQISHIVMYYCCIFFLFSKAAIFIFVIAISFIRKWFVKEIGFPFCVFILASKLLSCFQHSSCPTNCGTGMRASVHVKIPNVASHPKFNDWCSKLRLQVS